VTRLRVAVVGAGHLGRIHAQLLMQQDEVELIAVVDPDKSARQAIANATGVTTNAELTPLLSQIDAAIVATPTFLHHEIGRQLLAHGKHALIEKPLSANLLQADALVKEAARNDCILQVGHVERFNPAFRAAEPLVGEPKYIETRRLSGFSFRSMDIGVVMDLMIHDLDLVLNLVPGEVTRVQALGAAVLGGHEDMAQARLEFSEGCVVNLTASRTSSTADRSMNVYCESMQASIDFANRKVQLVRPSQELVDQSFRADEVPIDERDVLRENLFSTLLKHESVLVGDGNPIVDEHVDFIAAIRDGRPPEVTGQDGRNAVALAEKICEAIEMHSWDGEQAGRTGPHALDGPTILWPPAISKESTSERRKAG